MEKKALLEELGGSLAGLTLFGGIPAAIAGFRGAKKPGVMPKPAPAAKPAKPSKLKRISKTEVAKNIATKNKAQAKTFMNRKPIKAVSPLVKQQGGVLGGHKAAPAQTGSMAPRSGSMLNRIQNPVQPVAPVAAKQRLPRVGQAEVSRNLNRPLPRSGIKPMAVPQKMNLQAQRGAALNNLAVRNKAPIASMAPGRGGMLARIAKRAIR